LYLQQPPAHFAPHSGHHPGVGVGVRPTRHNNTTMPGANHASRRTALRGWAPSRLAPPLPPKMILSRPGVVRLEHSRRHLCLGLCLCPCGNTITLVLLGAILPWCASASASATAAASKCRLCWSFVLCCAALHSVCLLRGGLRLSFLLCSPPPRLPLFSRLLLQSPPNWIISSSVLSQRLREPAITRFARLLLRAVSIKSSSAERRVSPQSRSFFARPIARFTLRTESAQQPDRPADPQDLAFLALVYFHSALILLQPILFPGLFASLACLLWSPWTHWRLRYPPAPVCAKTLRASHTKSRPLLFAQSDFGHAYCPHYRSITLSTAPFTAVIDPPFDVDPLSRVPDS
jgi:hypothetical protein